MDGVAMLNEAERQRRANPEDANVRMPSGTPFGKQVAAFEKGATIV